MPNPNLTPEESFGWDAGVEFTLHKGRAIFDVTYFRANLTNKINGFFFDPIIGNFTAINLPGESTREGVEVSARYKVTRNLTIGGAYTYTDARDPNGVREVRRPPHSARADVAYTFDGGRGTATLAAIYNGTHGRHRLSRCRLFFPSQRVDLDAYWLVNATASYKLQTGRGGVRPGGERARSALPRGVRLRGGADRCLRRGQADVRRAGRYRRQRYRSEDSAGRGADDTVLAPQREDGPGACDDRPARSALLLLAVHRRGAAGDRRAGGRACVRQRANPAASSRSTCAPTSCWSSWWSAAASPP